MQIGSWLERFNINNISICPQIISKSNAITIRLLRTSLAVQWLRLHTSTAGGAGRSYMPRDAAKKQNPKKQLGCTNKIFVFLYIFKMIS